MDQAARGKKALVDGKYEQAVTDFTAALKQSPTSPDYLIQRSTAYNRVKNYASALADANNAVVNAQKRAKRELIVEGQFRRGCALYGLERYGDAEFVFNVVKRMDEKHKMVATWIQRTKNLADKLSEDDEKRQCNIKETPDAEELKDAAPNGPLAPSKESTSPTTTVNATPAPHAQPQQTPADKIRHEWYQNSEYIYFTLLAKGVPKDKAQIDIQPRSLTISFPLQSESTFDFSLDPLFGQVNTEKSIIRVLPAKLEIILAKAVSGQKWNALETNEPVAPIQPTTAGAENTSDNLAKAAVPSHAKTAAPAYPTSSKSGPKDWDKIVKESGKTNNDDDGDVEMDGDDDASPDVQRAMMKSYTESNGTALSTNWDEVSKGKVETVPPDGMEAKKWEK
jgi:suppressor of G2 allele of SKP1